MLYKISDRLLTMCIFFPKFLSACHTIEVLLCARIGILLTCINCFLQMVLHSSGVPYVSLCDALYSISSSLHGVSRWGSRISIYSFILDI